MVAEYVDEFSFSNVGRSLGGIRRWFDFRLKKKDFFFCFCRIFLEAKIFFLDEKLNNLDTIYSNRRDDLVSMHNLSTEEKLLVFQRNIELRTKENLREQVRREREKKEINICSTRLDSIRWNNSEKTK